MPSPFRLRTLVVSGLFCALMLTACSAEEDDDGPAPSAISPNTYLTCEDSGDCGEAGSVRWSLPVDDDYHLAREVEERQASVIVHATQWLDTAQADPGAVVLDGILYHHRAERVSAVELSHGEELWTEEFEGPVTQVQAVGEVLVVGVLVPGEGKGRLHLLAPEPDGPRQVAPDLAELDTHADPVASGSTHLVFRQPQGEQGTDLSRFLVVEANTGEVEWSVTAPGRSDPAGLTDDNTLYLVEVPELGSDEPGRVVGYADGDKVSEFEEPEEMNTRVHHHIWATKTGEILFDTYGCWTEDGDCGGERVTALDARTGELLWSLEESGSIVSRTQDGSNTLVHVQVRRGYLTLDARTGQILEEDAKDPADLLEAFQAHRPAPSEVLPEELIENENPQETEHLTQELDMIPVELTGPGVDELSLDGLAAGARHLTSYLADDGKVVGVLLGCAPDGVRPFTWEAGSSQPLCAAPRLFGVDYGI